MSYGGKNFNQCHHRAIAWRDVKHPLQSVKGFYLCPFLCCEVIVTPLSEIRSSQSYCRSYYNLWCFIDVFLLHQRGWLCRRHRWTHRRIVSQCESNATTELMPGELWHIRVCVCDGGVWERIKFLKVSVMMEQPDKFTMFLFLGCLLCAPNTLPHLSRLISIGFNSHVSHVVASQLKNKLRQYGSIWSCSK